MLKRRQAESIPARELRQLQNREREKRRRKAESMPERVSRPLKNREKDQRRREKETKQQRQSRIDAVRSRSAAVRMSIGRTFENATYNHDPSLDYSSGPLCIIGSMSEI